MKSYRVFIAIFLLSLVSDQGSKVAVERTLMVQSDSSDLSIWRGKRVPVWASVDLGKAKENPRQEFVYFGLNYVRNPGAAFGFLNALPEWMRIPFFVLLTVVAMGVMAFLYVTTPAHHLLARTGLVLILSGAVGNLIDRVRLGYVIDWIDLRWHVSGWRVNFPNFNIADVAVVVGVALLLIDIIVMEILGGKDKKEQKT